MAKLPITTILERIVCIDGDREFFAAKSEHYLRAFYDGALKLAGVRSDRYRALHEGRADLAYPDIPARPVDVDPNDNAHRSAGGQNSAVRDPSAPPDVARVADMPLDQVKRLAAALGAYDKPEDRKALAEAIDKRLRQLDAGTVADAFAKAWKVADLIRVDTEDDARRRLATRSATAYQKPNTTGRTRGDALGGMNPGAARRAKLT